jgi:hypothetical protein
MTNQFTKTTFIGLGLTIASLLGGCGSDYHAKQIGEEKISNVTVGKVQKEIVVGMSGAEVIGVLGSPNIITKDKGNKEVWVYDKLSTDFAFSNSGGQVSLLLLDGNMFGNRSLAGGQAGGAVNSGVTRLSQKTLTLIVKMTKKGTVEDFTYHASSF